MTSTQSKSTAVVADDRINKLVRELLDHGSDIGDLLKQYGDITPVAVDPVVPETPPLTKEEIDALGQIAQIFGKVVPKSSRKLTEVELTKLAHERKTIDVVLTALDKRKSHAIKHFVANHLDEALKADEGVDDDTPIDKDGHYLIKGEAKVKELGLRFERRVTDPLPTVNSEKLLQAHLDGHFTREEYLALTKEPLVKRTFNNDRARLAIRNDPGLLAKLAEYAAVPPTPQASIYLVPDKPRK